MLNAAEVPIHPLLCEGKRERVQRIMHDRKKTQLSNAQKPTIIKSCISDL